MTVDSNAANINHQNLSQNPKNLPPNDLSPNIGLNKFLNIGVAYVYSNKKVYLSIVYL